MLHPDISFLFSKIIGADLCYNGLAKVTEISASDDHHVYNLKPIRKERDPHLMYVLTCDNLPCEAIFEVGNNEYMFVTHGVESIDEDTEIEIKHFKETCLSISNQLDWEEM